MAAEWEHTERPRGWWTSRRGDSKESGNAGCRHSPVTARTTLTPSASLGYPRALALIGLWRLAAFPPNAHGTSANAQRNGKGILATKNAWQSCSCTTSYHPGTVDGLSHLFVTSCSTDALIDRRLFSETQARTLANLRVAVEVTRKSLNSPFPGV